MIWICVQNRMETFGNIREIMGICHLFDDSVRSEGLMDSLTICVKYLVSSN